MLIAKDSMKAFEDSLKLQKQLQDSVALDKVEDIMEELQEFAGTADEISTALGGSLSYAEPDEEELKAAMDQYYAEIGMEPEKMPSQSLPSGGASVFDASMLPAAPQAALPQVSLTPHAAEKANLAEALGL